MKGQKGCELLSVHAITRSGGREMRLMQMVVVVAVVMVADVECAVSTVPLQTESARMVVAWLMRKENIQEPDT